MVSIILCKRRQACLGNWDDFGGSKGSIKRILARAGFFCLLEIRSPFGIAGIAT